MAAGLRHAKPGLQVWFGSSNKKAPTGLLCVAQQPGLQVWFGFTNKKAPTGVEPAHEGFADLSLTTWVRRRTIAG